MGRILTSASRHEQVAGRHTLSTMADSGTRCDSEKHDKAAFDLAPLLHGHSVRACVKGRTGHHLHGFPVPSMPVLFPARTVRPGTLPADGAAPPNVTP